MSEEHKWQTEYWVRAAEDAGWRVDEERRLDADTQPDVVIIGTVLTGIEVRLSHKTAASAVLRTHKAEQAGVKDLWFTASDIQTSGSRHQPLWAYRVPTVGAVRLGWNMLPPKRSATATGLRKICPTRCIVTEFDRCPYYPGRGRSHCGKRHPKPTPWRGLTVDDVAGLFPAGEIVALTFDGYQRRADVLLVGWTDVAIYEELTGRPARTGDAETQPAATPRFGESPSAWLPARRPGTCLTPGCDRPARLYAGGWRCDKHLPLPFDSEYLGKLPP
jgi:hypothetical protein